MTSVPPQSALLCAAMYVVSLSNCASVWAAEPLRRRRLPAVGRGVPECRNSAFGSRRLVPACGGRSRLQTASVLRLLEYCFVCCVQWNVSRTAATLWDEQRTCWRARHTQPGRHWMSTHSPPLGTAGGSATPAAVSRRRRLLHDHGRCGVEWAVCGQPVSVSQGGGVGPAVNSCFCGVLAMGRVRAARRRACPHDCRTSIV